MSLDLSSHFTAHDKTTVFPPQQIKTVPCALFMSDPYSLPLTEMPSMHVVL